jgi:CRP-like cAMP-binding protein
MDLFDDESQVRSTLVITRTAREVAERSYERFHQICTQFPDTLYSDTLQLGKIVVCSREMAGRALKSLKQEGLLAVSGKTMVVHGRPR